MTQLIHAGVLGMKWGVRKARGPDSEDHTKAQALKGKTAQEMSNKEIQAVITRVGLERQLNTLVPPKSSPAIAFIQGFLGNKLVQMLGKQILKEKTGVDLDNPFGAESQNAMLNIINKIKR